MKPQRKTIRTLLLCTLTISSVLFVGFPFFYDIAATSHSFVFTAAGDFGYGGDTLANFQAIGSSGAAFHLVLGDLSYGEAPPPTEQTWCSEFRSYIQNVFVVVGNHDSGESSGGDINVYAQHCPFTFANLGPGSSGPSSGYGKEYYFDYPASDPLARFIMTCAGVEMAIDGTGTCDYSVGTSRHTWLSSTIDDAKTRGLWVIVGGHKNYVSTGPYGGDSGQDYFDLLLAKKVDIMLQAHDHTYQRSKQLTCCFVESTTYDPTKVAGTGPNYSRGAGTVIINAGTGGWGLYTIDTADPDNPYFETWNGENIGSSYGHAKFTVSSSSLTGTFEPVSGGTFTDSFNISSCTGPCPQPPGETTPQFSLPPAIIWLIFGLVTGGIISLAVLRLRKRSLKHDRELTAETA